MSKAIKSLRGEALDIGEQALRLHGGGGVVEGVRVLGGLPLQLALVVEGTRTTVTEKPANNQTNNISYVAFYFFIFYFYFIFLLLLLFIFFRGTLFSRKLYYVVLISN